MMTKKQKILMWVFIAMFAIPEILFYFTPWSILSIVNNFGEININPPIYSIINSQFLTDHSFIVSIFLFIEWLGVLGALAMSIKLKKIVFVIMLSIAILWLSFLGVLYVIFSNMSLVG